MDIIKSTNLTKTIWQMAIPVMMQMILQSLLGFVDTGMIGRLGSEAIAGVSIANTIAFALVVIGNALSVSGQVIVTRYKGAGNHEKINQIIGQCLMIVGGISLVITVLLCLFGQQLLGVMGATDGTFRVANDYLSVLIFGIPFSMLSTMFFSIAIGLGHNKVPLYITIMTNGVNIVLNYILIFKIGLEAKGAAIATVISYILGFVFITLYYLLVNKIGLKYIHFKPSKKDVQEIFTIGIPAVVEALCVRLAFILYTRIVMGIGTIAMAAHTVANTAESISFMPGFAFGSIVITFVGQFIGAGQVEKAKESAKKIDRISMFIMGLFGVVFVVYPEIFIRLFSNEEEVIHLASKVLRVEGMAQIFFSRFNVYSGILKAYGQTKKVLFVSLIGLWCVRLPLSLILIKGFNMGLMGAWIPMFLDYFTKGIILTYLVKKLKWETSGSAIDVPRDAINV